MTDSEECRERPDVEEIAAVARATVLAGGTVLRRRYRAGDTAGDYSAHDVKAAADEAAEAHMLPVVRRAFPDHTVFSEEAGEIAGTDSYRWILDPLDGTNNFAAGLPTFTSAVAVLRNGTPIVGTTYQPVTDETYLARRDGGIKYQHERVSATCDLSVEAATVVMIVGREVPRDPVLSQQADEIRERLGEQVKRVIDSWAPTVHAGLFARGRVQGVVQFHPDEEEQAVTELFAREAGAATRRDGPLFLAGSDESMCTALWNQLEVCRQ